MQVQHERFCENFFKLRSSGKFHTLWNKFISNAIRRPACPTFFQAVTDQIADVLIKNHFMLESISKTPSAPSIQLDGIERNVIRYMAGYVIHSLKRKTKRMCLPMKNDIIICLSQLEEDAIEGWYASKNA